MHLSSFICRLSSAYVHGHENAPLSAWSTFSVDVRADNTQPLTLWVPFLPSGLGGLCPDEPTSRRQRLTRIKVWPVLAFVQADTPFMRAAMGACGHTGHHACWRCGTTTVDVTHANGVANNW